MLMPMPSALRAQIALVGMLACLLIPIGTSSLRGLTHILTCQEASAAPFSVVVPREGLPLITSSNTITRENPTGELCGGLVLDIRMASRRAERAEMVFAITNRTEYGWRGSVRLKLGKTPIPIDIGEISSGETETDSVELHLDSGKSYQIAGSLLIGP
jgi:hypothetical protein